MNILNPNKYNIGRAAWLLGWHIDDKDTREDRVLDAIEDAQGWALIDAEPLPSYFRLAGVLDSAKYQEWSDSMLAYTEKVEDVKRFIKESRPDLQIGLYGPSPIVYQLSMMNSIDNGDLADDPETVARRPEFVNGVVSWVNQFTQLNNLGVFEGVDALMPPLYNSPNYDPEYWIPDTLAQLAQAMVVTRLVGEVKVLPCIWHRWSSGATMEPQELEQYARALRGSTNHDGFVLWSSTHDRQDPAYKQSSPPTAEADEAMIRLMRLLVE